MVNVPFPIQAGVFVGGVVCVMVWRLGVRREVRREKDREVRVMRNLERFAPVVGIAELDEEEKEEICAICLSQKIGGGAVRKVLCGHSFHGPCLERWIHCSVESHLDIRSFVRSTQIGILVPASPGPSCPLCKKTLRVIDEADVKEAVSSALHYRLSNRLRLLS